MTSSNSNDIPSQGKGQGPFSREVPELLEKHLEHLKKSAISMKPAPSLDQFQAALRRELASATDRFTIPELKRSVQSMIESLTGAVEKDIMIVHAIADSVKESLTITKDEYKQFTKDRDKHSHPHLERRPKIGRK